MRSARCHTMSVPLSLQGQLEAHQEEGMVVSHMAIAGVGIWVAFTSGSTLRLFHTETLKHLQDVNIATPVHHMLPGGASPGLGRHPRPPHATKVGPPHGWVATPVHHMLPGGASPWLGRGAQRGALLRARAEGRGLFLVVSRPRGRGWAGPEVEQWRMGETGWRVWGPWGVTGWPHWAPPAPGREVLPQRDSEQPACRAGGCGPRVARMRACVCRHVAIMYTRVLVMYQHVAHVYECVHACS